MILRVERARASRRRPSALRAKVARPAGSRRERGADLLHRGHRVVGVVPPVRVELRRVRPGLLARELHRHRAREHDHLRLAAGLRDDLAHPRVEVVAVLEHDLRAARRLDVGGARLVLVRVGVRLQDLVDGDRVAADDAGPVGDLRRRRDHDRLPSLPPPEPQPATSSTAAPAAAASAAGRRAPARPARRARTRRPRARRSPRPGGTFASTEIQSPATPSTSDEPDRRELPRQEAVEPEPRRRGRHDEQRGDEQRAERRRRRRSRRVRPRDQQALRQRRAQPERRRGDRVEAGREPARARAAGSPRARRRSSPRRARARASRSRAGSRTAASRRSSPSGRRRSRGSRRARATRRARVRSGSRSRRAGRARAARARAANAAAAPNAPRSGENPSPSASTSPGKTAVPTACEVKARPRRTIQVPSRPAPTASSSTSSRPRWTKA